MGAVGPNTQPISQNSIDYFVSDDWGITFVTKFADDADSDVYSKVVFTADAGGSSGFV